MYETTTPSQKVLNQGRHPRWTCPAVFLVLLGLLLMRPAVIEAQASSSTLWFSGLSHTAEGQAFLESDPVSGNLIVSEIGNTGLDGVTIRTGETNFVDLGFADLDPALMEAGNRLEYAVKNDPNSHLARALATVNNGGRFDLAADFSPLGTDSYTALVMNNGNIVYTEEGIPNGGSGLLVGEIVTVCMGGGGEGDPIDSIIIYIVVEIPEILTGGGSGPTVYGNMICLIPNNPTVTADSIREATILADGIPSLTLTKASFKFNDFKITGYGESQLLARQVSLDNWEMNVGGVAGSGSGFSADLPDAAIPYQNQGNGTFNAAIQISDATPIEPAPGRSISFSALDPSGSENVTISAESNAQDRWNLSAEFPASPTYTVNVYNGSELVYSQEGIPIGDGGGELDCIWWWFEGYCRITTDEDGNTVHEYGIRFCGGGQSGIYTPPNGVGEFEFTNISFTPDVSSPNTEPSCTLVLGGENLPDFTVSDIYWEFNPHFLRGDANSDGGFNIGDAVFLLAGLFSGGELGQCLDASDANDDGALNVADPVMMLSALFSGGSNPGTGTCEADTTPDSLDCVDNDCD